MTLSRRDVCASGALGALALGLGACFQGVGSSEGTPSADLSNPIPRSAMKTSEASLGRQIFAEQIGTQFTFQNVDGATSEMVLTNVEGLEMIDRPAWSRGESFSLLFEGVVEPSFEQSTYHVSHAALGSFAIFVVPAKRRADIEHPAQTTRAFSATFNRV